MSRFSETAEITRPDLIVSPIEFTAVQHCVIRINIEGLLAHVAELKNRIIALRNIYGWDSGVEQARRDTAGERNCHVSRSP